MPAPERTPPAQPYSLAINPLRGIVGYYSADETDALLAGLATGTADSAVTSHDGPIPQPTVPTPTGVEDAYRDLADGLHFYKDAATLVAIVRQPYQTTIVVQGPNRSVAKIVKSDAGLPTPQNPSTLTQNDGGQWLRLSSDELTKPFAPTGVVDLFSLPAGVGGERPAVYETTTAPVGDLKDGDLWLSPATTLVTARQLATLSLSDPACAAFRQSVMDEVRSMMAGGKTVPADIDWTPCVRVSGTGQIDARVLNGMIQLRGELAYTSTSVGSFSTVQRLPANFPRPPSEQHATVFGYENGVAYRRVFVRFIPDGGIAICGDGKITHTALTGATAYAY